MLRTGGSAESRMLQSRRGFEDGSHQGPDAPSVSDLDL
jgi:hypothetical protein